MATKTAEKPATKAAAKRGTRAKRRSEEEAVRRVRRARCNHHWVIDPPNGPTSSGHCKLCGRARKFPNSSEDSIWDGAEGRSRWNDMGMSRRRRPSDESITEENVVTI